MFEETERSKEATREREERRQKERNSELKCIYCGAKRGLSDYGACKACERRLFEAFYDDVPWIP